MDVCVWGGGNRRLNSWSYLCIASILLLCTFPVFCIYFRSKSARFFKGMLYYTHYESALAPNIFSHIQPTWF